MRVTLGGDLRQVGHAQHLTLLAEGAQLLADDIGHRATDAGVDFVEHHGRYRVEVERGHFDGQRNT
ncbi:hypothetical protein D3C73_1436180 [compost metagenome]